MKQDKLKEVKDVINVFLKTTITFLIVFYTGKILIIDDKSLLRTGIFIILLMFLPTLFFIYFKAEKFFLNKPKLALSYKIIRAFYFVLVISVFVAMFWRVSYLNKKNESINKINNTKITIEDVMGKNLPKMPDKAINDSTIEGVDANNNNIRDDVELAIFGMYPNSAKIRLGLLQYAQALQLEIIEVNDKDTFKIIMQKRSNGQICMDKSVIGINENSSFNDKQKAYDIIDKRKEELENNFFNTEIRAKKQTEVFDKYMTTYSIETKTNCDIDIEELPN